MRTAFPSLPLISLIFTLFVCSLAIFPSLVSLSPHHAFHLSSLFASVFHYARFQSQPILRHLQHSLSLSLSLPLSRSLLSFISGSLKRTLVANVKGPAGIKQVPSVAMSTVQESAVEQFDLLNIINNTIKVMSHLHFTFWTPVCCREIPGLDSRKPGSLTVSGTAFPLMTEKSFH